ncbi:polysaccharide biosynthesis protein [Eubacterium limosum]|nr:polysaccharide biosynthesis protein [Eubacterium limosum]
MLKNISVYEFIFYVLLMAIPVVDCITGYLLLSNSNIGSTIGQFLRIITIIFLFLSTFNRQRSDNFLFISLFCFCLFLIPVFNYFRTGSVQGYIDETIYITKLILPILMILGIYNARKDKKISSNFIDNIFSFYIIFVPLSLIIPKILGIGYVTYENFDVGYKGFYYAGNELNILLLSISVLSFQKMTEKFTVYNAITALICLGSLFLMGTKTSFLVIIFLIIYNLVKKRDLKNKFKVILVVVLVLCISYFVVNTIFKDQIEKLLLKNQYYYETLSGSNDSITNFIFSNRNARIGINFEKNYIENSNEGLLFKIFFGVGHYQQFKSTSLNSIIEMDFFDTLLWYGLFAALAIFAFYTYVLYIGIIRKKNKEYLLCYLLIYLFSLMAGHVWYSALAGSVFGMIGSKILE